MPTGIILFPKRPPPSPIVAPPVGDEEPTEDDAIIAAEEPVLKVPKLGDGDVHAEATVASHHDNVHVQDVNEPLPVAEIDVLPSLPLEEVVVQGDDTVNVNVNVADVEDVAPLSLDMPPGLEEPELPPLSPIKNSEHHQPAVAVTTVDVDAQVIVANYGQEGGVAGAEELNEASQLLSSPSPFKNELPSVAEGAGVVAEQVLANNEEEVSSLPLEVKNEPPSEIVVEEDSPNGVNVATQAMDDGAGEEIIVGNTHPEEEMLDEETANVVIDMAVDAVDNAMKAEVDDGVQQAVPANVVNVGEPPAVLAAVAPTEGMAEDSVVNMNMAVAVEIQTRGAEEVEGALVVNLGEAVVTPAERVAEEQANDAAGAAITIVKKVVLLGAETGEVIKTESFYEEHQPPAKRVKKERREFTAEEKLKILSELEGPNALSVNGVLQKHGVSKSSLHRWRQPEKMERLQEMVLNIHGNVGSKDKMKKRDMNDKLRKIKLGLQAFCKDNMTKSPDVQLAITSSLIQLKATEIKDQLLKRYEEIMPDLLTEEEFVALTTFKASKSWACLLGNQLGYLSTAGAIEWSNKAKENTTMYLKLNSRTPPKTKKQRMEFTAQQKLSILQELEDSNSPQNRPDGMPPVTVEQICKKYHTSKSSLHRWKQQYRSGRLQELAETGSGFCNSKRVFNDKLHIIKKSLNDFYVDNENAEMEKKIPINYTTLQARAIMSKELLLMNHYNALHRRMVEEQQQEAEQKKEVKEEAEPLAEAVLEVEGEAQAAEGPPGSEGEVAPNNSGGEAQVAEGLHKSEGEAQAVPEVDQIREGDEKVQEKDDIDSSNSEILSKDLVHALENFKASNSWLRETAKKFGWKLDMDGKKDSSILMDSILTNVNAVVVTAPIAPPLDLPLAAPVYHHPNHHQGMEQPIAEHHRVGHPVAEHHGVEHHRMEHPVAPLHHGMEPVEHPVATEHVAQQQDIAQDPIVEELGVVENQTAEQHHTQNNAPEGHQMNEHYQQHEQMDHLAPNMGVYDAQGNAMTEMMEDPMVQVEEHVVDEMADHGNEPTYQI